MSFVNIKPMADKITCKGGESIDISFDVINTTDAALRVGVRATGPLKDKKWVEIPPPVEIELPARGQQKVKVTVKIPAEAAPVGSESTKTPLKVQIYDLQDTERTSECAVIVETPAKSAPPASIVRGTTKGPNWALIIGGIVGGVVVLSGIGVLVWMLAGGAKMPDVVGKTAADAQAELEKAKIAADIKEEFTGKAASGTVISQTPKAGEAAPKEKANLVIELASVPVPQIIGLGVPAAKDELIKAGLTVGEQTFQTTSKSPGGTVTAQTPAPGARIIPGDKVNMTVEKELVNVPSLLTLEYAQATKLLEQSGLLQGKTTTAVKGAPSGTVLEQSPTPGTRVDKGTAVDVVVQQKMIKVPNVMGNPEGQAQSAIQAAGLTFRPVTQYQSNATNTVVAQDPRANADLPLGSDVVVVVERRPMRTFPGNIYVSPGLVMKNSTILMKAYQARSAPPPEAPK